MDDPLFLRALSCIYPLMIQKVTTSRKTGGRKRKSHRENDGERGRVRESDGERER